MTLAERLRMLIHEARAAKANTGGETAYVLSAIIPAMEEAADVIDKLPVDAEGRTVMPSETQLYHWRHKGVGFVDDSKQVAFYYGRGEYEYEKPTDCYQSREAAEVARKER